MLIFDQTCLYIKVFQWTYFIEFMRVYGILLELNNKVFNPKISARLHWRSIGRLTGPEVGRPVRSTDVHRRAQGFWLLGRSTDPVDRPESSAIWIWPRSTRQSTGRLKPKIGRLGDRPAGCNGQKFDCWPVDQAVDRQQDFLLCLSPMASFWRPIYWGCFGLFWQDFWRVSKPVFSI